MNFVVAQKNGQAGESSKESTKTTAKALQSPSRRESRKRPKEHLAEPLTIEALSGPERRQNNHKIKSIWRISKYIRNEHFFAPAHALYGTLLT